MPTTKEEMRWKDFMDECKGPKARCKIEGRSGVEIDLRLSSSMRAVERMEVFVRSDNEQVIMAARTPRLDLVIGSTFAGTLRA